MAIPSPAEYVTPPAVLMVYVSTPVSDVDFVTVTLLPWATLIRLRTAALPVSEMLSRFTLALPVLRDEIELLIAVIDVLIVPIAVVCSPTVVCNELILDAFSPIAVVCPLTVVCNVLIAVVLAPTFVFKVPTLMEESVPPSLTSSAILPELIVALDSVAPVRVVLVRLAPSIVANFASAASIVYASVIP